MNKDEIMEDLFFIERGFLNGNHFVYRSKSPILIDTGYITDFSETERLIKSLEINPFDVSLIINTNTHCDHIGGNKIIQEKSGCDIALHKIGRYFIEAQDDWSTWWRYYNQEADFFNVQIPWKMAIFSSSAPIDFKPFILPAMHLTVLSFITAKKKS